MNPVEAYLKEMHDIRSTGGAVDETRPTVFRFAIANRGRLW